MGFFQPSGIRNRRGFFGESAAPFNPSDVSGLTLWLKADAGVTQSGGIVTAWADQSQSANNFSNVVNGPVFVANAKNNYPAISFDDDIMDGNGVFSGSSARTLFVVYFTDNSDGVSNTIAAQNNLFSSETGTFWMMQARNDFLNSSPYLATYNNDLSGPEYVNNEWVIAGADYDGEQATLYKNGQIVNTAELEINTFNSGNCFSLGGFYEPAYEDYAEYFGGQLTEVVAYSKKLSQVERQNVTNYLNNKYDIF